VHAWIYGGWIWKSPANIEEQGLKRCKTTSTACNNIYHEDEVKQPKERNRHECSKQVKEGSKAVVENTEVREAAGSCKCRVTN
jgi:hypothetical protein